MLPLVTSDSCAPGTWLHDVHGINLIIEAVRQIRGTSCNQVPGAQLSLVTSGNMVPTGALLFRGD